MADKIPGILEIGFSKPKDKINKPFRCGMGHIVFGYMNSVKIKCPYPICSHSVALPLKIENTDKCLCGHLYMDQDELTHNPHCNQCGNIVNEENVTVFKCRKFTPSN